MAYLTNCLLWSYPVDTLGSGSFCGRLSVCVICPCSLVVLPSWAECAEGYMVDGAEVGTIFCFPPIFSKHVGRHFLEFGQLLLLFFWFLIKGFLELRPCLNFLFNVPTSFFHELLSVGQVLLDHMLALELICHELLDVVIVDILSSHSSQLSNRLGVLARFLLHFSFQTLRFRGPTGTEVADVGVDSSAASVGV